MFPVLKPTSFSFEFPVPCSIFPILMIPCSHCGEELPDDAVSCRECGSDLETGWNPDVEYHSVEIPDCYPWEEADSVTPGPMRVWFTRTVLVLLIVGMPFGFGALLFPRHGLKVLGAGVAVVVIVEILFQGGYLSRSLFRRR